MTIDFCGPRIETLATSLQAYRDTLDRTFREHSSCIQSASATWKGTDATLFAQKVSRIKNRQGIDIRRLDTYIKVLHDAIIAYDLVDLRITESIQTIGNGRQ